MNSWKDRRPRSARELARAVGNGRSVGDALRHLDVHASEPDAVVLAEALASFLVERCDSHHAGWRAVRRVVVDSSSDPPWEKCARRAVPDLAAGSLALVVRTRTFRPVVSANGAVPSGDEALKYENRSSSLRSVARSLPGPARPVSSDGQSRPVNVSTDST